MYVSVSVFIPQSYEIYLFGSGLSRLGIYDLLKNELGFRYTKINKKGYYLREINGIYKKLYFHYLDQEFRKYIEQNFKNLEISTKVNYKEFMDEYYNILPIKNGNYARDYLSEDFVLSETNLELILCEIDPEFQFKKDKQEMLRFIKDEGFIESIDKIGNFYLNCPLFYKKISGNMYLIFNVPFCTTKSEKLNFDLWKINAKSENDFLFKKIKIKTEIILGFDLRKDINLYKKEKII